MFNGSLNPRSGLSKTIKRFLCSLLTLGLVPLLRDTFVVMYCLKWQTCDGGIMHFAEKTFAGISNTVCSMGFLVIFFRV